MADARDRGGWRVLPLQIATAAEQLARTEALWQDIAAERAQATMRWYGYAGTALVLGVGQPESDVDSAAAREMGVAVVRRTSGGSTVLANSNLLALDVALPATGSAVFADVVESYRWLGDALIGGLHALAPHARDQVKLVTPDQARADQAAQRSAPAESADSRRVRACFGVLSPYEVAMVEPSKPVRKLVGLSQLRKRGVVLYQVGFYRRFGGGELARFLRDGGAGMATELDRRIAALDAVGLYDDVRVIEALTQAIASAT